MNEAAKAIVERFAFKQYGQVIKVDPPVLNEALGNYVSNVRANYPVYIFDDRSPQDYAVRVLKIKHLGQITLNKDLQIIPRFTTYGQDAEDNLVHVLNSWKKQVEHIVVSASSNQLIKIEKFRNHFSQIERILEYLMEYKKIHQVELTRYLSSRDKRRIKKYINLLESIEIIRFVEPYYEIGNRYITIEGATKPKQDLMLNLLSHIIEYRYPILRDEFGLTILEKTVSVDNVIYLPELETESSVFRSINSIANNYKKYYNRNINPLQLNQILRRLEKAGAICRKGSSFYGDETLREDMITRKKKLAPLSIAPLA